MHHIANQSCAMAHCPRKTAAL